MGLDPKVVDAIRVATQEAGQPVALARRLTAWLEAAADGNTDMNDVAAADRYLEVIYEGVALGAGEADGATADAAVQEDDPDEDGSGGRD